MVSILPRVGLHENTEMNSFCMLRLFRLDTLHNRLVAYNTSAHACKRVALTLVHTCMQLMIMHDHNVI